jgi:hypothetical protein
MHSMLAKSERQTLPNTWELTTATAASTISWLLLSAVAADRDRRELATAVAVSTISWLLP